MSSDPAKVCPSCKRQDYTDFRTCRFCGTRYDAKITKPSGAEFDQRILIILCILALGAGTYYLINTTAKEERAKRLAPIAQEIRASGRPRVLEFYADWCGPCRQYGPIIEACRAKYSDRIDFERLNVDDPNNRSKAIAVGVSAIPLTCMFDSKGNEVSKVVGGISSNELDDFMHKLLVAH